MEQMDYIDYAVIEEFKEILDEDYDSYLCRKENIKFVIEIFKQDANFFKEYYNSIKQYDIPLSKDDLYLKDVVDSFLLNHLVFIDKYFYNKSNSEIAEKYSIKPYIIKNCCNSIKKHLCTEYSVRYHAPLELLYFD